jgi:hypothetical protein
MACEVALAISVKVQTSRHHPSGDGPLPDSGVDHLALPFHIGWKTDVH